MTKSVLEGVPGLGPSRRERLMEEFGTVEASLLSSVAAILGIHSGNIELYRQQSELLAGVVRALTSAPRSTSSRTTKR